MGGFVDAIGAGAKGLTLENSVYLPFRLELLSIWLGKEMSLLASPELIVDMCEGSDDVAIRTGDGWTNIVFRRYRDLDRELGDGKGHVVLCAVEEGGNIFSEKERHFIRIWFTRHGKEISFEIIDDPFNL